MCHYNFIKFNLLINWQWKPKAQYSGDAYFYCQKLYYIKTQLYCIILYWVNFFYFVTPLVIIYSNWKSEWLTRYWRWLHTSILHRTDRVRSRIVEELFITNRAPRWGQDMSGLSGPSFHSYRLFSPTGAQKKTANEIAISLMHMIMKTSRFKQANLYWHAKYSYNQELQLAAHQI